MPDKLPIIQPDREHQVFNGVEVSYGIAPILSTFSRMSGQARKPYWNLFLINVETIIRDCNEHRGKQYESDLKLNVQRVAQRTLSDCTVLAQYIATYSRLTSPSNAPTNPVICFYLGHYENIPKLYLRDKFPKGTEERWLVRNEIESKLKSGDFPSAFDNAKIVFTSVGIKQGTWPHRELLDDLSCHLEDLRYRKVLMISHVPLDFHLCTIFNKNFSILESYTGVIKTPNQFGKKVFNTDVIPFTKYTHLLYGDKYYLKPLINTSTKRQVKEVATKEHWALLPEKSVLQALLKLNLVRSELFIKPNI